MLKSLFFVLLVSFVANADDINNLSDVVVKDINGEDFQFKNLEGECVLVITTASENQLTRSNLDYLNDLTKNYPKLEIVAFPSNSPNDEPKSEEELKKWFFEENEAKYHVMGKTEIKTNEVFNFLTKIADNKAPKFAYMKYLIQRDGKTARRFNAPAGPFVEDDLTQHIKSCLGGELPQYSSFTRNDDIKKLSDVVVKDINGENFEFNQLEGKCVLVITTASENQLTQPNLDYLNELTKNHPQLKIVAFPSNSPNDEPKSEEELKKWFFEENEAKYHVMAKTEIKENKFFKFLTKIANNKIPKFIYSKYLIQRDGITARRFNPPAGPFVADDLTNHINSCISGEPAPYFEESSDVESEKFSESSFESDNENQVKVTKITDLVVKDLYGNDLPLKKFEGKCILFINTASEDYWFTNFNMEFLNHLTQNYKDLEIIAVPSNSFRREPKNTQQLQHYFIEKWNAKYNILEKTDVKKSELFRFLATISRKPDWNFIKYLIRRDGKTAKWFAPHENGAIGAILLKKAIKECLDSEN